MSITPKTHRHTGAKQARKPRGTRKATKTARRGALRARNVQLTGQQ